jgi:hypothetical protein
MVGNTLGENADKVWMREPKQVFGLCRENPSQQDFFARRWPSDLDRTLGAKIQVSHSCDDSAATNPDRRSKLVVERDCVGDFRDYHFEGGAFDVPNIDETLALQVDRLKLREERVGRAGWS